MEKLNRYEVEVKYVKKANFYIRETSGTQAKRSVKLVMDDFPVKFEKIVYDEIERKYKVTKIN